MKILMTSDSYLPRIGGAEIHVANLVRRLKRMGHSVHIVTNESGSKEEDIFRLAWSLKNSVTLFLHIWEYSKNVDIIHSHYCHRLAFLSVLVGFFRRKPVVVTLHGYGILNHITNSYKQQVTHAVYRYVSLKLATLVISTSNDLAEVSYKYIKKEKVKIIFNGYDEESFSGNKFNFENNVEIPTDKKVIMTVRRLVPKNGVQYLVQAFPRILKKQPNSFLVLLGDGPLFNQISKNIKDLNIENNVLLLGKKSNEDVLMYLTRADIVVFPSTAESASIACIEAMALGKVIVASRVGGLVELLGSNQERGYLVKIVDWEKSNYSAPSELDVDSYESLAKTVAEAIDNTEISALKSEAAKKFAKDELSWDIITHKIFSEYNKCLN